ncbi:MAG: hypothetical protein IKQ46_15940 [Bacteroidales bacterium]|nr:hypothetical protein [Bacteroidales bacterium]
MNKRIVSIILSITTFTFLGCNDKDEFDKYKEEHEIKSETTVDVVTEEEDYQAVDLGLSVYWCNKNLGASNSQASGYFYAFGETTPKESYTWANYKHANGTETDITKYNTKEEFGKNIDDILTLEPEDDAVVENLGNGWRMPDEDEFKELRNTDNCTWEWVKMENLNIAGYKITSKINGNSIFLPAAGFMNDNTLSAAGTNGNYWSRSLYPNNPNCAQELIFFNTSFVHGVNRRCYGNTIRAVKDKE